MQSNPNLRNPKPDKSKQKKTKSITKNFQISYSDQYPNYPQLSKTLKIPQSQIIKKPKSNKKPLPFTISHEPKPHHQALLTELRFWKLKYGESSSHQEKKKM